MSKYTKKDIIRLVEEEDVEFIRLQFTDMFGTLKNIAITARELPRALNNDLCGACCIPFFTASLLIVLFPLFLLFYLFLMIQPKFLTP